MDGLTNCFKKYWPTKRDSGLCDPVGSDFLGAPAEPRPEATPDRHEVFLNGVLKTSGVLGLVGALGVTAKLGDEHAEMLARQIMASETPYRVVMNNKPVNVLKQREEVLDWLKKDAPRRVKLRQGDSEEQIFASDLKAVLEKIPNLQVYEAMGRGKVVDPAVVQKR